MVIKFEEISLKIIGIDLIEKKYIEEYLSPYCNFTKGDSKNILIIDRKSIKNRHGDKYLHEIMRLVRDKILELLVISKKYLFFHASCFEYKDCAYVIIGKKNQGKTSLLINSLLSYDVGYISNDLVIYNMNTNECFGWPKAPSIRCGTLKKYPELQEKIKTKANEFKEYCDSPCSLNEFLNSTDDRNKIRLYPKDFVKIFDAKIIAKAKLKCFIIPKYSIVYDSKIELLEECTKNEILQNNMHIDSGMYRDIDILDKTLNYNNIVLNTIPIYNLYLNETNYKDSLLKLLEKTNG